jgi:plasmid maintenance system antidote protein VapI
MAKAKRPAVPSEILRQAILDCGRTRYELAKETGVSQPVLSRFVNGQRDLTLATVDKLAPTLGLELVQKRPPKS